MAMGDDVQTMQQRFIKWMFDGGKSNVIVGICHVFSYKQFRILN